MEAVILIMTLLFVVFVTMGVYAGIKVVGAARRGVDRTLAQARRTVEDTTLRAKSLGQPGVAGELAQLRLRLRTSMRATQDALFAGVAQDPSLKESIGLFERLSTHGHELDDDLKGLERDPNRARIAELLPVLRERTERITHSAESLRWAARERARQFADDDLTALSAQIEVESGALRDWATDPLEDRVSEAAAEAEARSRPARPQREGWAAESGGPEAITARDRRQQTAYPWQKSTRPETTT
jgi:hypothetical protein